MRNIAHIIIGACFGISIVHFGGIYKFPLAQQWIGGFLISGILVAIFAWFWENRQDARWLSADPRHKSIFSTTDIIRTIAGGLVGVSVKLLFMHAQWLVYAAVLILALSGIYITYKLIRHQEP